MEGKKEKICLTSFEKNANNQKYYRDKIDGFFKGRTNYVPYEDGSYYYNSNEKFKYDKTLNMKVNYDLFNGIINKKEFSASCKTGVTFLDKIGKNNFSDDVQNIDITSNKIKTIMGLDNTRPLDVKVVAINPDATTRKEQKLTEKIKEFVYNSLMMPVRQALEVQKMQEIEGRELTEEETQQINQEIEESMKSMTPTEVKEYMETEHQDPAEIQAVHLLNYLKNKTNSKYKFSLGCKQAALVAHEAYCIFDNRGNPDFRVLEDFTRATYDESPDINFFEDGDFFCYEYLWNKSQMISFFGDDLTKKELEDIESSTYSHNSGGFEVVYSESTPYNIQNNGTGRLYSVFHATWKDIREIRILSYYDEENEEVMKRVVDESYKINPEIGDIEILSEYASEAYEGYLINGVVYKKMRPIPGQFRDINDLFTSKLPYYGAKYDNTSSRPTSIMDRGKIFQYYNNIVNYRAKKLMASDKGKKIAMSYKSIPDTEEMTLEDFFVNSEDSPYMLLDPTEEGNNYNDVNTAIRVVDLSLASDIKAYYEISERLKMECSEAMGITRQMEGQIQPRDGVGNTKQALVNNTYLLDSFLNLHDIIKLNVLNALIEYGKVVYENRDGDSLSYVLDDMSLKVFEFDYNLLKNSTIGLFLVNNNSKAEQIKQDISTLSHAAMQNGTATLSEVLSILKEESIENAEAKLKKAEKEAEERRQAQAQQEQANAEKLEQMRRQTLNESFERQKENIILKEEERRKTELAKLALTGASFNPDKDDDNDGINDFIELAENALEKGRLREEEIRIEKDKLEHQKKVDEKKLKLEEKKINKMNKK